MMTNLRGTSSRAIIFGFILLTGPVVAFTHLPPPPSLSVAARRRGVTETVMKRGASDGMADNNNRIKSRKTESQPRAFGWTRVAGSRRPRVAARGARREKVDWSKLFATPEPEPVGRGRALFALSRSFAGVAQESLYASPLFLLFFALLISTSPTLGGHTVSAWALGRLTFSLSMRGEDASRRLPVGFVGYASLFLVLGSLAFMNGLKGISRGCLIL